MTGVPNVVVAEEVFLRRCCDAKYDGKLPRQSPDHRHCGRYYFHQHRARRDGR